MEFLKFLEGIRTPLGDAFFSTVTHLGEETIFILVGLLFFWCINKKQGYFILSVGFLGTVINQFLKLSFRIPRPWVRDPEFTRGCVGYVHAIGHTLGSLYGVPHGLAMSVLLPHVMRAYGEAVHERLADLANACGISGKDSSEKANAFLEWIEKTNARMMLPNKFEMIRDEDIDQMITWAQREANPLYPVPVVWGRDDFRDFIQSIRG